MESIDVLIVTRSFERIVASLLGGGAIYLGFQIFKSLPNIISIDDNYKFRQYILFNRIKILAGAVFMILGAYIVLAMIVKDVTYQNQTTSGGEAYSGVGSQVQLGQNKKDIIDYQNLPNFISSLNNITDLLPEGLDPRTERENHLAISRIKLNLMLAIWNESSWGDPVAFREWVISGATQPQPPNVNAAAVQYFNNK